MTSPSPLRRIISLACSFAVIGALLMLWSATGRAVYTQQYDAQRAAQEAASTNDLAAKFPDLAAPSGSSIEAVPNRFMFGLLPSTYPWNLTSPALLSVLTVATPTGIIAILQILPSHTTRRLLGVLGLRHHHAPAQPTPAA